MSFRFGRARNGFGTRRSKYGAQRTNGFGSKLESAVYDILKIRENAGEISDVHCQPSVKLTEAQIGYKPDFKFTEVETGEDVWVEAKGVELEGWRLRKKLWRYYGPGRLQIFKGNYRQPKLVEELIPARSPQICPGCGARVATG